MSAFLLRSRQQQLIVLLFLLIFADGIISRFLTASGLGIEANPVMQSIIGGDRFLLLKAAGGAFAGLVLWDIHKRQPKIALVSTALFVAFYTVILYWNLAAMFIAWL